MEQSSVTSRSINRATAIQVQKWLKDHLQEQGFVCITALHGNWHIDWEEASLTDVSKPRKGRVL